MTSEENDAREEKMTPRQIQDERIRRFPERLCEAMGKESVRSFARKIREVSTTVRGKKFSESVLRKYLNGTSYPSLDRLLAIADTAGVSILWLATGTGPTQEEQIGVREGKSAYTLNQSRINKEVLREIEYHMNIMIEEEDLDPTPEQKAKFVSDLYEYIVEGDIAEGEDRAKLIRLVVSNAA